VSGAPYPASAAELKQVIDAERRGAAFLLLVRDVDEQLRVIELRAEDERLTIGRRPGSEITIEDPEISRVHAELVRVGGEWAVVDDGLSRNGTFVNAVRADGRRRLRDGDVLSVGQTAIAFRALRRTSSGRTVTAQERARAVDSLTPAKRRVLAALCRPFREQTGGFAVPAANKEIAAELFLTVPAVRTHLRELFRLFELGDLPDGQKRIRLVELAFRWGLAAEPCP
jgi:FHA domain